MTLIADTASKLRSLRSYDSLLDLLDSLGFTYSDEQRSTSDWPANIREAVQGLRVAALHGSFLVFYAQVDDRHMLTWERQVVSRILSIDPHSLFVFTDLSQQVWHFIHVRYDERLERRRQLRRFVVDLRQARGQERLRTTAERLSRLAISPGQSLSALEVQELCDEAFRISEVTKQFLSSFVRIVGELTGNMVEANPTLLTDKREALRQAQLLMDRLVFLYFIQRKGWLNGGDDYLYQRFRRRYLEDPQADTFYREYLLPHLTGRTPGVNGAEKAGEVCLKK